MRMYGDVALAREALGRSKEEKSLKKRPSCLTGGRAVDGGGLRAHACTSARARVAAATGTGARAIAAAARGTGARAVARAAARAREGVQ